jgi:hypothetical protein
MARAEVSRKTATAFDWQLVVPVDLTESDRSVFAEISEFRGRILYADGRRPRFRQEHGRYGDDDPLDSQSFHVVVRGEGGMVGYIRVRRLPEHSQSSLGRLATAREFEEALGEMRVTRTDCLEVSRWIVAPAARGTAVASMLVVSAWAIGRWLGKRRLLASVGLRDGQAAMLARYGGRILQSIDAKLIAEYDDEVATMQFELACPPPCVAAKLDLAGRLLRLEDEG